MSQDIITLLSIATPFALAIAFVINYADKQHQSIKAKRLEEFPKLIAIMDTSISQAQDLTSKLTQDVIQNQWHEKQLEMSAIFTPFLTQADIYNLILPKHLRKEFFQLSRTVLINFQDFHNQHDIDKHIRRINEILNYKESLFEIVKSAFLK